MTASSTSPASRPPAAAPAVRGGIPDPDAVDLASTQHTSVPPQSSRIPSEATTQATHNYRLPQSVEDGINVAVAGATTAPTAPTAPTTAPARQHHHAKWTIIKYFLRWASMVICAGIIIGETFESILNEPYFGTVFGIIWTVLIGGWDIWRIDRLRKRRGIEYISPLHLIAEGSIVFSGLVSVIGLAWASSSMEWNIRARGIFLVVAVIFIMGAHGLLFFRAYIEEHRSTANAIELSPKSTSPQQQPAQVIVQYVQVCPHCSQTEPMTGESMNAAIAARGELQPQNIRPEDTRHPLRGMMEPNH